MGWFYGFKLHLIINEVGEILTAKVTPGNIDDRQPIPEMTESYTCKLFGDKGYISKKLDLQVIRRWASTNHTN